MAATVRPRLPLTREQRRVRKWILDNRGKLTEIAAANKVSHQFVQKIAYAKANVQSRGLRIERTLRDAGCPGIKVG